MSIDEEIAAMSAVLEALKPFDAVTRARILDYAISYFDSYRESLDPQ